MAGTVDGGSYYYYYILQCNNYISVFVYYYIIVMSKQDKDDLINLSDIQIEASEKKTFMNPTNLDKFPDGSKINM